jgi:ABC-type sugar transport system permease subunit
VSRRPPVPLALLAPFLGVLAALWLVPLAQGVALSLESDTLYGPTHDVGLAHYRALLGDGRFRLALANTLGYAAASVVLVVPAGLALALLLRTAAPSLRGLARFCLLLPGLTPPLVLAFLFVLVFGGRHGLLNTLLAPLGVPPLDWLKDPPLIRASLVLQAFWRWTGFVALFLHAGLESIPRAYVDLARAEGASPWGVFRHVTLPLLSHVLGFVALLLTLDAFVLFSGAYVLLGASGGTADAGLLLVGYAYQTAFTYGRFGSAAAVALSVAPLLGLLAWAALRLGRRWEPA